MSKGFGCMHTSEKPGDYTIAMSTSLVTGQHWVRAKTILTSDGKK